jgi:hypothetical protein
MRISSVTVGPVLSCVLGRLMFNEHARLARARVKIAKKIILRFMSASGKIRLF